MDCMWFDSFLIEARYDKCSQFGKEEEAKLKAYLILGSIALIDVLYEILKRSNKLKDIVETLMEWVNDL